MVAGATQRRRRPSWWRVRSSTWGRRLPDNRSDVGVEDIVQPDARAGTVPRLDGAGDGVANEQQVVAPGELAGLDDRAVRESDLRAGREIEAGLDDAVVAERDAEPGLGAQEAAFADPDPLGAATRERAHDRGATADIGAVVDDDALDDAALAHGGPEGPRVVVAEPLVHDRGALGQVRAEAHAVGIGDANAGRQHIVGHPRE